jgi:hypothetical protein
MAMASQGTMKTGAVQYSARYKDQTKIVPSAPALNSQYHTGAPQLTCQCC